MALNILSAGIEMRIEASVHFIMAGVFSLKFSLKDGAALQCYVPFNCFTIISSLLKDRLSGFGIVFLEVETLRLYSPGLK